MKPASKLPFAHVTGMVFRDADGAVVGSRTADTAYLVHAANLYPELVAALLTLTASTDRLTDEEISRIGADKPRSKAFVVLAKCEGGGQ